MDKKTEDLLKSLSEKLGTTTEYLWKILLEQAKIDAITTSMQIFLVCIFSIVIFKIHNRLLKEDKNGYSSYDNNDAYGPILIICAAIAGILLLFSFLCIGDIVNGFLHPEYWALKTILDSVSHK